jgi:hypothetical protein
MRNHILIDFDVIDDAKTLVCPTQDRVSVNLPRPRPIGELERWRLRPVSIRSRRPLEASF